MIERSNGRAIFKIVPEFAELGIPDEHGICRGASDYESGHAVQKTPFEDINLDKFKERSKQHRQETAAFPLLIHILRQEPGELVHRLQLPGDCALVRKMEEIVFQVTDLAIDVNSLVNPFSHPSTPVFFEKPELSIRIKSTMSNPSSLVKRKAGYTIAILGVYFTNLPLNLILKRMTYFFVSVNAYYPISSAL
jgi:hypothetical protein